MLNSNVRTAFAAMTGVGVLLGGAGSAQAVLVQTFSVDEQNGPTSQALSFDAATPNQGGNGVLAQVSIAFSTLTVGGGDQATLTGGEGGTATRGGLIADVSITDLAGTLFSGSTTVAQSSCTVSGISGCTGTTMSPTQPVFSPGSPVVITDGGALANFVGGPVQLTALITNYNVTPPTCDQGTHAQSIVCGGFDNITWAPTVTVSYTYNDILDTPEPTMLGILGLGGATLGLLRRRRKPPEGVAA